MRVPLPLRRAAYLTAGLLGAVLVAWLVIRADPGRLAGSLAGVDPAWLALALVAQAVAVALAACAWQVGLRAGGLGPPALRHTVACHWLGQGANALLPARLGEVARVAALRRHLGERASLGGVAASLAAQRLLAGVSSFVVVSALVLCLPLPGPLAALRWPALGALAGAVAVGGAARRLRLARRAGGRLPADWRRRLGPIVRGAAILSPGPARRLALWLHAGEVAAQLGALVALLLALHLPVPPTAALVVFCAAALAALAPALPGGLGLGQAAVAAPLATVYGVGAAPALAYALGTQAVAIGISLAGGALALAHQRLAHRASSPV